MTSFTSKLALAGAFAAQALAHGTVTGFVTDGKYNGGFLLDYYYMEQSGQTPPETAGWYAENLDNGFVDGTGYDSADISCHRGGRPATSTASVSAGGTIEFQWTEWPESHIGPVITYAAPCEGDCADADVEALKWVKIEEAGYDASSESWAAIDLIENNNTWVTTVPETLAAGNYVFRHEIIALHGAGSENGAQNYPQCFNIEVTGSGTESPEGVIGAELYSTTEEGILFDPYSGFDSYTIPGPALMSGGGSGGSAPPSDDEETDAPSSAAPTDSAAPTTTEAAEESDASEPETPVQTDAPSTEAPEETETPDVEAPSQGNQEDNSSSTLPETFTLETFIEWLKETAGASTNARRHARDITM